MDGLIEIIIGILKDYGLSGAIILMLFYIILVLIQLIRDTVGMVAKKGKSDPE